MPKSRWKRGVLLAIGLLILMWAVAWVACYRPDPKASGEFAWIEGKKIRYIEQGQGPLLLLIHGSPGSIEDWEPTRALLVERYRVIAVDRPGQGHSDLRAGENQMATQADALARLLKERAKDPAIVLGHSYGGAVALAMATRHPEQVRGVVHVAGIGSPERHKGRRQAWSPLLRVKGLRTFVAQALGPIMARLLIRNGLERAFDPESPYLTKEIFEREFALWSQPRVMINQTLESDRAYADLVQLWPQWASIKVPVYLLAAKEDRLVSPDEARDLFKQIPEANIQILPNASHMLPITQPKAIATAVASLEKALSRPYQPATQTPEALAQKETGRAE